MLLNLFELLCFKKENQYMDLKNFIVYLALLCVVYNVIRQS